MISNNNYKKIDTLIEHQISFALYRLPEQIAPVLVLQHSRNSLCLNELIELNGKTGFVIAPFEINEFNPLVYIQPDIIAEGEQAIFSSLQQLDLPPKQPLRLKWQKNTIVDSYKQTFKKFIDALEQQHFEKLVLSRPFSCDKDEDFSAGEIFKKACNIYPSAFVYLCHTPQTGTWLGSSPELMISGQGEDWHTVALAGTRKFDQTTLSNHWDDKNKKEQQIVTDYVSEKLTDCELSFSQKGPYTIQAGGLEHLKTEFAFTLKKSHQIGNLLEVLHPTPAVCGLPKTEAYHFLIENEGYNRSYYSGFIGYLNPQGKTDLYVNLRCMQIESGHLTVFAGGGLLPSSELQSEWQETEEKLQTMLLLVK